MALICDSGRPFGVTSVHVSPPSRVTWIRPSSDPVQITLASTGEGAMVKIVPYTSPPAPSFVIGPPPGPCLVVSLRVRSGLITSHESPRSPVRSSTLPPW